MWQWEVSVLVFPPIHFQILSWGTCASQAPLDYQYWEAQPNALNLWNPEGA